MLKLVVAYLLFALLSIAVAHYLPKRYPKPESGATLRFNVPRGTRIACFAEGKPYWMGVSQ